MKKIKTKFIQYVSLNIIGMIGQSCYILADTYFIAKALGTLGLASLNFSISAFSILQGLGLMIGIGGATDFLIRKQQSEKGNNDSLIHALTIGAVFALIFTIVGIFFTTPLSKLLGANEEALPLTKTYLTTILCFSPFFILNNIMLAFVRNDKNPKLSMAAMLISSFSNVLLDYIFMFPLSMGMFGAAFATGLSPIISLMILSLHFRNKNQGLRIKKSKIKMSKMFRIMSLGFSSFIAELASAIALISFNLIIINIEGNTGVAAYGVVANIALIATAIFVGIAQGIQPLASKYYGQSDVESLNIVVKYMISTATGIGIIIYFLIYFFSAPIVAIFNSEEDIQLALLAINGVKIYFIGYFFASINIVTAAFLSAISKAKNAMIVAILRSSVILLPLVFAFSKIFMMNGVWLSFVVTEFIVFIISLVFLIHTMKNRI